MKIACCECTILVPASSVLDSDELEAWEDLEDPDELIPVQTPFDGTDVEALECGWAQVEFGWKCSSCMVNHVEKVPTSDMAKLESNPLTALGVAAKLGPMLKIQIALRQCIEREIDPIEYMVHELHFIVNGAGDCKHISNSVDFTSKHRDSMKMECKGIVLDSANRWSVVGMLADEFEYEPENTVVLVYSHGGSWKFHPFVPPSVVNFTSVNDEDLKRLHADQAYGWDSRSCYTYEVIERVGGTPHFRFVGRRILSSLKSTVQFHG